MFSKLGNKKLKSRLLTDVIFAFFLLVSATFILGFTLNRPLSEVYAEGEYSISSAATTNGGFSLSQETALSDGETITVTTTPNIGYEVDQMYYINSSLVQTDIVGSSFTMPADNITVYVTFVETDFTLSKGTETNGTFSLSVATANYGDSITVTTTPDANYHVSRIYYIAEGDSTEIEVIDGTFAMPASNITVYVEFTNLYTVTFKNNDNSTDYTTVDVVNGETVTSGNMPADLSQEGYYFVGWSTTAGATSSNFSADTVISGDVTVYPAYLIIVTILDGALTASSEYTGSAISFIDSDFGTVPTGATITAVAANSNTARGTYTVALTLTASEGYILNDGTTTSSTITVDGSAEITVSTVILTFSETAYSQLYGAVSAASATADKTGDFTIAYTYEGRGETSYTSTETMPTALGLYNVTATVVDANGNYTGSAVTTFDIKQSATVTFVYFEEQTSYVYSYDAVGAASTTTNPADLSVIYTYVGTGSTVYNSTTTPTAVGTYNVTATIDDINYQGSATTTFEIVEATLNYTASGYSGSYDASSHGISVVSSTSDVTVTYSFDNFVTTESGNPTFTYPNDNNGSGVLASDGITVYYKIEKTGYTTITGSETVTISPRAIVIKPQDISITYGDEIPTYSLESINFAPGEDISVLTEDAALVYTCSYVKGSIVDTYTISVNAAYSYSGSNYTLSYETGTLTVNKAQLTITADNIEIGYNDPIPTYTAQYSGFVNDETASVLTGTLSFSCPYQQGYDCDTYSITLSGVSSDNYSIQFVLGTLTVSPKEVTITFSQSTYSQTYGAVSDASATTNPTGISLTYLYEGTGDTSYSSDITPTATGTYNVTATVGNKNYTGSLTTTFTITKAALTITALDTSIHYLGAIPTYNVSYSGFITGEDSSYLSGLLSIACTYEVGSDIGTYTITPSGLTSDNYEISFVNGTLTVTKLTPVLIAYPTVAEVIYSPTLTLADASITGGTVKSNATEDGVVIEGTFVWTTPTTSISVGDSGNSFEITFVPTNTTSCDSISFTRPVIINKATPVIVEPTTNPVTYSPTLTLANVDLNGASADTEGTFNWSSPGTGLNYTTGTSYEVIFTPTDGVNYNTASMNVTVVVNKATLTTVNAPTTFAITYTTTLMLSDVSLNGGSASYNETSVAGTFTWTVPTTSLSVINSGSSYDVTFTPDSGNYNSATTTVAITVNKATATITFGETSYSQTYGAVSSATATTSPEGLILVYTYTGTGSTVYSSSTTPTNVGTYSVTAEVSDDNYEGSSQVSFTISAATPTITAPTTNSISYFPDMTLANISLNGGSASYSATTVSGTFAWSNSATSVDVTNSGNSYYVTFTPTDTTNYNTVTNIQVEITIIKATPTIVAPAASTVTYTPSLTLSDISLSGGSASVNSTTISGTFTWESLSTSVSVANSGSTYSVTFNPSDTDNYNSVTGVQVQITVSKATASLVSAPTTDAVTYAPGLTLSGVALNGGSASISGTFEWMSTATELNYTTGTNYSIKFIPTDTTNYNVIEDIANVTVVVNKATPTIVAPTTNAVTYTLTLTLGNIALNGGSANISETNVSGTFAWTNSGTNISVVNSGASYSVIFTPESSNYNTVTTTVSITVTKATATVTFASAYSQTYGSVSGASATTTPADLTLIYTYVGTGSTTYNSTTTPVNVGTYNVTAEISDDNYEGSSSTTFAITQKALTVTADDISIYYLDAIPEYTVTYSGFENGDTASALQGYLSFSCEYSLSAATGTYTIIPGGLSSVNYDISFISGTLTVNKIVIDTTGVEIAASKAYTGSAISFTLSDTFRNVPAHSTLTAVESNSNTDAGVYYVNVTLTADSNYEFDGHLTSTVMTATLHITSQNATVTFPVASAIIYGQTLADSELTGGSVSGGGSFEWQASSTMPTVAQSGNSFWVVLTPNNVLDYDFSSVTGYDEASGTIVQEVSLVINPRTVSSDMIREIADVVYTGSAITPSITVTYNGETLVYGTDYSVDYSDNTDAGSGTVTITGAGNFTNEASKQFTITPRTIIITALNRSITYGNSLPNTTTYISEFEPEGIFTPVVTIALLNLSFEYNKADEVVTPKNVGSYTVNIISGNPNYVIEYYNDTRPILSIQRKSLTVDWSDLRFIADGNTHKPIAVADTGVTGETIGLFVGGSQSLPGKYTATAFISPSNSNYSLINPTQQFEIVEGEISDDSGEPTITVDSEFGFSSGTTVSIEEVSSAQTPLDASLDNKVIASYDVKVLLNNSDVVLGEGNTATITMYIGAVDSDFVLYVSQNGEMVETEYTLNGDYITFSVSEFGYVSLVKVQNTTLYWIIAIIVVVVAVVVTIIVVRVVKKKKRGY